MPHKTQVLLRVHKAIEQVMKQLNEYVDQWMHYQGLWDLQPDLLYERLGTQMDKWMNVIMAIKKSRVAIDSPDSHFRIFPFVVDFTKVQSKVSIKYDYWQREVLQKFGIVLGMHFY